MPDAESRAEADRVRGVADTVRQVADTQRTVADHERVDADHNRQDANMSAITNLSDSIFELREALVGLAKSQVASAEEAKASAEETKANLRRTRWTLRLVAVVVVALTLFAWSNHNLLSTVHSATDPSGSIYQRNAKDQGVIIMALVTEGDCRNRRRQAGLAAPSDPSKSCPDQTPADIYPGASLPGG